MTPTIELREITANAGNLPLSINTLFSGTVAGVFGHSGAGKTTLLEMIAGLRRPDSGRIAIGGTILFDFEAGICVSTRHRKIGYVPQDLALFPHLDVRANVSYGKNNHLDGNIHLSFKSVCEAMEIGSLLTRYPATLSGGEKQRVAFARALVSEPALLLMDEPLSSLDEGIKDRILPYLLRIRDEFRIPMIYVSHAAREIVTLCHEVAILTHGKITAQGHPSDLFVASNEPHYRLRVDMA